MRLFDPDRPRLQGRPLYPAAKPRYAAPDLSISFTEHAVIGPLTTVSVMLCVGENRFSWFSSGALTFPGLLDLIQDWIYHPEVVMESFGWTDPRIVVSPAATKVLDSLEIEL